MNRRRYIKASFLFDKYEKRIAGVNSVGTIYKVLQDERVVREASRDT